MGKGYSYICTGSPEEMKRIEEVLVQLISEGKVEGENQWRRTLQFLSSTGPVIKNKEKMEIGIPNRDYGSPEEIRTLGFEECEFWRALLLVLVAESWDLNPFGY